MDDPIFLHFQINHLINTPLVDYDGPKVISNRLHNVMPYTGEVISKRTGKKLNGSLQSKGYKQIEFQGGKVKKMWHHYIFEQAFGICLKPGDKIDHRDGNRLNNKIQNLRLTSNLLNAQNKAPRANLTGYKGVTQTKHGKYSASLTVNKERLYLGSFASKDEAGSKVAQTMHNANKNGAAFRLD
jgi:hypothetical protein